VTISVRISPASSHIGEDADSKAAAMTCVTSGNLRAR
jgi:hypothetical protein